MEYRLSKYITVTDPIDEKGTRMLLSTRSTQILLIPPLTFEYMMTDRINEIPVTVLEKLIKILAIVDKRENELSVIINENDQAVKKQDSETLYEVIQPTSFCQLNCYYCGQKHSVENISPYIIDKIVNRIRLKITTGNYKKMIVGWFGGEPLLAMAEIRALTSRIKEICSDNGLEYSCKMVSNGYSLTNSLYNELVTDLNLKSLEVTIDGIKEFHDLHRYTKNKTGSFEKIFSNLISILTDPAFHELGSRISVRCNIDQYNYESVIPLLELMAEKQLHDKIVFYTTEIHSWGNDAHKLALDGGKYSELEISWLKKMIEKGFKVRLVPKRRYINCVALSGSTDVYDAFGNISNCTEVSYVTKYDKTEYVTGNVSEMSEILNIDKPFLRWNEKIPDSNIPCKTCFLFPMCGGACPKSWREGISPCPSIKYNINDKLKLLYTSLDNKTKQKAADNSN